MENKKNNNLALFVLCAASFLVPFMGSALNLALPQVAKSFSMDAVTLSWVSTSYLISTAIFQIPLARLADMVGRKKIFVAGIGAFSVCTLLCGIAVSGSMLILLRLLSGIGSAMMFGTGMAILTSIFPKTERGKVLGINVSVVYAAIAAGPFLGGVMTHYFGWRSLFFICGATGLATVICALLFLKGEWIEAEGEKFDFTGAFVYAAGLFGMIYGFSKLPHIAGFMWIAAGVLAFVIFVLYEQRLEYPIFNVRIFSGNKTFTLSSLAALINYAATFAAAFMMSLYLQYVRGFDAQHAGLILIVQACVQTVVSLYAGRLSDRVSAPSLASAGMGIIVAALGGLAFLSPSTPMFLIIIALVLLGLGFGMFSSPNTNVIMSSVEPKQYSQASATTGTMRLTGQAFSMGIAMMALSVKIGNRPITPELHPQFMSSLHITFGICALLCVIGTVASSVRRQQ